MILLENKNIWSPDFDGFWRCITTNVGWRKNGENVMGAGLAKQAKDRYPNLPMAYGKHCREFMEPHYPYFFEEGKILCLPSKTLNERDPHLSWQENSDFGLIKSSYLMLKWWSDEETDKYVAPLLGTRNGGLDKNLILELVKNYKFNDNVTILI